jgi:hypothetical protein
MYVSVSAQVFIQLFVDAHRTLYIQVHLSSDSMMSYYNSAMSQNADRRLDVKKLKSSLSELLKLYYMPNRSYVPLF